MSTDDDKKTFLKKSQNNIATHFSYISVNIVKPVLKIACNPSVSREILRWKTMFYVSPVMNVKNDFIFIKKPPV